MAGLHSVGSRRSKLIFAGWIYLALIAMTAVFLFPLLWVIGLSLKTRLQVFANPPLFVWWPTLENYVAVLGQADFVQAFVNSLVVSAGAVVLSICVGVPAAYAFARFPFRGGSFLFFSLLVMRMLPPIAVLVPMYILFSKFGLTTTRLSVILAYSTFSLPLVVWIMRGFFEDLPRELEESAWVDGASRYRRRTAAAYRWVSRAMPCSRSSTAPIGPTRLARIGARRSPAPNSTRPWIYISTRPRSLSRRTRSATRRA